MPWWKAAYRRLRLFKKKYLTTARGHLDIFSTPSEVTLVLIDLLFICLCYSLLIG